MKIYHMSCGSLCPLGGRFFDGVSPYSTPATLVCHCLLIEYDAGLILVDTGFGLEDVRNKNRIPWLFRFFQRPHCREENTALRQIQALGYQAQDVRHIVLTHLDFDHAGGLADFPQAEVHISDEEYGAVTEPRTLMERLRFRSDRWPRSELWHRYRPEGDLWFGLSCMKDLRDLPPNILLIPLPGHTRGHCGVAVQNEEGHWLLLAGDAYFHHSELDSGKRVPLGTKLFQRLMESDHECRLRAQASLRELKMDYHDRVTVISSHDRSEYRRHRKLAPPPLRLLEKTDKPTSSLEQAI